MNPSMKPLMPDLHGEPRQFTPAGRRGFTLTEMLVVIAIIVIFIGLAVPAINSITGTRSVGAAQNNLSALLVRAREEAIGLQEMRGVMFYLDPGTDQVVGAIVRAAAPEPDDDPTLAQVYLDLVQDRDYMNLPQGIRLFGISNNTQFSAGSPPVRQSDGYVGFNTRYTVKVGSCILFDGSGRVVSKTYGFRCNHSDPAQQNSRTPTAMGQLLAPAGNYDNKTFIPYFGISSQYGFVLFDKQAFQAQGFNDADSFNQTEGSPYFTNGANGQSEKAEEDWLDQNATPVLVNRYNGTLIRAE